MQQVQRSKRIQRWRSVKADGTLQRIIRYGSKPLELAKGKNAVEIASESVHFSRYVRLWSKDNLMN